MLTNLADRVAPESRENLTLFPLIYGEIGIGENTMGKRIEYQEGQLLGKHEISFIEDIKNKKGEQRKALMKCSCGKEFESCIIKIKNNNTKSCGCLQGKKQTIKYSKGQLIGDHGIVFINDIPNNRDSKRNRRMAIFKCACGKEFEAYIDHVKTNYHTRCSRRCTNFIPIYENGQILGDHGIKLLEEIDTNSNEFRKAKFRCHCGKEFITGINSVKANQSKSCGCEQNKSKQYIKGQNVGSNGIIFLKDIGSTMGSQRKALLRCHCGKEYITNISAVVNGYIKSCGCTSTRSIGGEAIKDILESKDINFDVEHKEANCRDKNALPFDFAIKNKNLILGFIEYDGKQHFESIDFFGGEAHFLYTKKHDQIKNEYCVDNNIPLLRIPYTEFSNIENITNAFLTELEVI
jgi:hypothetical protein